MDSAMIALAGGAAAFAHCLGMCGGFVLHLSLGEPERRGWARPAMRQALWHIGRISGYAFVGALAGWAGSALPLTGWQFWQRALAVVAGAAMAAAGLVMLGLRRGRAKAADAPPGLLAGMLRFLPARPSTSTALAMGMICGVLPCPVVLAFAALAASTQSVAGGIVTMTAMGVGTIWSLALLAAGARLAGPGVRRWAAPVGGVLLIVLGAVTVLRATPWHHAVLGCCPPAAATTAPCPHCTGPTTQP